MSVEQLTQLQWKSARTSKGDLGTIALPPKGKFQNSGSASEANSGPKVALNVARPFNPVWEQEAAHSLGHSSISHCS